MKQFNQLIQAKFAAMCATGKLFRVELSGDSIWRMYLDSFSKANNPIFRDPASTSKNCNHCNNFIRRYGNIVALDENNNIVTMFAVAADEEYGNTADKLTTYIIHSKIKDVFFETFNELNSLPYEQCKKTNEAFQLGTAKNHKRYNKDEAEKYGVVKEDEIREFHHMHLFLGKQFVDMTGNSVETIMGHFRDAKNVFQKAMETISLDTLNLVKDLINQGSLLDGATHLHKIEAMIPLKKAYDALPADQRDNWCWATSYGFKFAKFKNELIGVLCSELSEGEELNKACQAWNKRVDPANYMKATAPITQKQIDEAQKFVDENGFGDSFTRRLATIDDIKASEILHVNAGNGTIKQAKLLDGVKADPTRHKRNEFDGVEEVTIDKFMADILPGCTSVEALLGNKHEGNMVTMTTAHIEGSKPAFKWPNNYSWSFNGNLAGKSQIKEAVKEKGGRVDGVLRFSIIWNENGGDNSDLDAHCKQPDGVHIFFSSSYRKDHGGNAARTKFTGQLDVDIVNPHGQLAVENIAFETLSKMGDGVYKFWVNQYNDRGSVGFKAEIEFEGETFTYEYNKRVAGNVQVAEVTLKDGKFSIEHMIPESAVSSREIYGLNTNQFHKVSLVCLSPNHWGKNEVGNKHYFFMLDGCKAPNSVRGFHNENLLPDLANHRKVFEVLGTTKMIPSTDKQLSGLGFNATVRDEVILKLQGTHKRMIKVKF